MKTQSILKTALCLAGLSAMALSAQAQVVINENVAVGESSTYDLSGTSSNPSTVAPLAYTGTIWNDLGTSSGSGLLDSTGATTGVGFSLTGYDGIVGNSGGNPPDDSNLVMVRSAFYGAGTMTLTITGLTASNYDLALVGFYGPGGGSAYSGGSYTVGSTTLTDTAFDHTSSDTFVEGPGTGSDYVEFTNLSPVGGSITVTINPNSDQSYGLFNGFQLEAASVPEPSTVALIGLGALGLAFLIRRHRTV